jgi:hypothetical protein
MKMGTSMLPICVKLVVKKRSGLITNAELQTSNAKLDASNAKLDVTNAKLDATSTKLDVTSTKLDVTNAKLDATSTKFDVTNAKLDRVLDDRVNVANLPPGKREQLVIFRSYLLENDPGSYKLAVVRRQKCSINKSIKEMQKKNIKDVALSNG